MACSNSSTLASAFWAFSFDFKQFCSSHILNGSKVLCANRKVTFASNLLFGSRKLSISNFKRVTSCNDSMSVTYATFSSIVNELKVSSSFWAFSNASLYFT